MHFLPKCIGRREQSDDAQGQHDDGIPENTRHKHTSFKSPANAAHFADRVSCHHRDNLPDVVRVKALIRYKCL